MEFDFLPQKIEGITSRQKWGLIFSNSIVVIIKVTKDKVSSNPPSDMHTWDLWRRQNYFAYFLQNYDKVKEFWEGYQNFWRAIVGFAGEHNVGFQIKMASPKFYAGGMITPA